VDYDDIVSLELQRFSKLYGIHLKSFCITDGGVSLAEFQGGGKCLIKGWSDI
jgi:hypothetical protein